MKRIVLSALLLAIAAVALNLWMPLGVVAKQGATAINAWADSLVRQPDDPPYMSIHYRIRELYFTVDPSPARPVVFLGDSITYGGDWGKLFPDSPVENRGIGGDSTRGLLRRLDQVIDLKPSQIFLMIGTNDLCYNRKIPDIIANYRTILGRFRRELPNTRIYVQSVLPFNDKLFPARALRNNVNIAALNVEIRKLAAEQKMPYIDLTPAFTGPDGRLPAKYTDDGLHLSEAGYYVWRDQIKHLVATPAKKI
ncbi:SGNH/GDSL hydrolase family protein [Anaeroselena agilis]|uniref:SGNH/GDSL hydrolase family protein n=1 Tax=Anaeroselena agilis TaxID=3063788 RepID=A0ABU3NZQ8_9FIRM|nr:SGNH/GDSL hydrolase family protein [Selenomonadales bacterium 4137-cl]